MTRSSWTILLAAVGLAAAGCGPDTNRTPAGDADRDALVQRVEDLKKRLEAARGVSPEVKSEFDRLTGDVRRWREQSARDDIRVQEESTRGGVAAKPVGGNGGSTCEDCPGYTVEPDQVCLLEEEGECPDEESIIGRICVYRCIWIGSGSPPERTAP